MQCARGGQEGAGSWVGPGSSCAVRGVLQLCDPCPAQPLHWVQQLQEVSDLQQLYDVNCSQNFWQYLFSLYSNIWLIDRFILLLWVYFISFIYLFLYLSIFMWHIQFVSWLIFRKSGQQRKNTVTSKLHWRLFEMWLQLDSYRCTSVAV